MKLSNSQPNKLKAWIKSCTEVTLKLSWNVVGDSNDENNFSHKLLLTNAQISKLRETFANSLSADMNYQKLNCIK